MPETLGPRALNRALLARQLLLRRVKLTPLEAVRHLCGLQAQAPFPPYYGLWSRLHGFRPEQLAQLLLDREVVRIALMRGTVHLVTAEDALWLRPVVQPLFDRDLRTNTSYAKPLATVDLTAVANRARALLDEEPRTPAGLGQHLAEHWPDTPPTALAHAARGLLPLVQVPPRAVWGRSGRTTLAHAETWLGRGMERETAPASRPDSPPEQPAPAVNEPGSHPALPQNQPRSAADHYPPATNEPGSLPDQDIPGVNAPDSSPGQATPVGNPPGSPNHPAPPQIQPHSPPHQHPPAQHQPHSPPHRHTVAENQPGSPLDHPAPLTNHPRPAEPHHETHVASQFRPGSQPEHPLERLVLRYLAAFGPASVADVQAWSGLTRLAEVVERLRPHLCVFRTEQGREVFDLPDAPRPDPGTPAPPRFIAEFDNLLLSHADRSRVLPEDARKRVFGVRNGVFPGTILLDGLVRGSWRIVRTRGGATLAIEPYERFSKKDTAALESAGVRLLRFAVGEDAGDIRFAPLA